MRVPIEDLCPVITYYDDGCNVNVYLNQQLMAWTWLGYDVKEATCEEIA